MPHIHTEPGQHDFTASAYIVRTDQNEPKIVLHRHKKLHVFMQFGGHIELNETPWQAVSHEILEESGYEISQLTLLQPKGNITSLTGADLHPIPLSLNTHHFNQQHFHTDIAWAFVTDQSPKHSAAVGESNSSQLFSRQEVLELAEDAIPQNVRETALFVLDTCIKDWEKVR